MSLLIVIVGLALYINQFFLNSPVWLASTVPNIIVEFKKGSTLQNLVNDLSKQAPLKCQLCFKLYLKFLPRDTIFQAGYYELGSEITPQQVVEKLINGDILHHDLILKPGETTKAFIDRLSHSPLIKHSSNLTQRFKSDCKCCKLSESTNSTEGCLLADTYTFRAGVTGMKVLKRLETALMKTLKQTWVNRDKSLNYNDLYQLLIAASIIEKETSDPSERNLISSVIQNRLKKGMMLQMDPTVIYALGDNFKYPLSKKNLKVDSPYNTYFYRGLPPSPIANVGIESIEAAAHPADTDYLYFVAMPNGKHQFSQTLVQHNRAVQSAIKLKKKAL